MEPIESAQRTLYLDGCKYARVLLDGPALRVRQKHVSDRLYPLQRLVQVIVNGQVEWSTNALLACAEAHVPVFFLTAHGSLRARVLGVQKTDPLLNPDMAIEAFLEQHEATIRYRQWFSGKSQQARLSLIHAMGRRLSPADVNAMRKYLEQRARLYARSGDIRRFDRQIYGLLLTNCDKKLRQVGLDTDLATLTINNICIARDFANFLIWLIQNEKLRYLKQLRKLALRNGQVLARLDWFRSVQFYEQNKKDIEKSFDEEFRRFHIFLVESIRHYGHQ